MKRILNVLQKIGKSLMLPVSVLPAAGILLRLGYPDLLNNIYLLKAGNSIINNLPIIFAVGVAIGFSEQGEGVAALSAVVGELIIITISVDSGVLSGILIGLLSVALYNKYHDVKLPQIIGFFGGERFVIIITAFFSLIFAIGNVYIGASVYKCIDVFAKFACTSILGPALYAAGKRFLIPLGLHHMYYPVFLYEFGSFVASDGIKYFGDFGRYFHGDPTAGRFMASEYPILMFGLPAAALAITLAAKSENRKKTAGMMITAAAVSFFTGITEPIEFSFIFAAPELFLFHVLAAFTSGIVTSYFNIRLGYTFSASFIDYILGYKFSSNGLLLIPVGIAYFLFYFLVFYFVITKKNIKTLGREDSFNYKKITKEDTNEMAEKIIKAIGGKENVNSVHCCITRLRISIRSAKAVDVSMLKKIGILGIIGAGNIIQIIIGTEAETIKTCMEYIIKGGINNNKIEYIPHIHKQQEKQTNPYLNIKNPIRGNIIPIENVDDDVFSEKILGEGFGIIPDDYKVYSPVDGKIKFLFPSNHALSIETKDGLEILIHIGIDTAKLKGIGFKIFVNKDELVQCGRLLIEFDKELLLKKAVDLTSPIVITGSENFIVQDIKYGYNEEKQIIAKIH